MAPVRQPSTACTPGPPAASGPAGDILVRFRDSLTNWEAIKKSGHWQGWDDETPTFLWSGVVLDFDQRVREM